MSPNTLSLRLVGADEDDGVVRFDDFRSFCNNLSNCLQKAESLVSSGPPRIRYRIAALETGSAAITLEAMPSPTGLDFRQETLAFFSNTVACLQRGEPVDPRMDVSALNGFRALVRPMHRNTKEIWIDGVQLTSRFEANIDAIVGSSPRSRGSVSGVLEQVNVHNKCEFYLYPPIGDYRIKCVFDETMLDQVRSAIRGNVTVCGSLRFRQDSPFPHLVHVETLELHPPDDALPTLSSLKGIAPECTGDMDSVGFVRAIRDEQ